MLNATISVHGSLLADPFAEDASIPQLPIPSTTTLQHNRAPNAQEYNQPHHNELPSSDSELSDENDEESSRPAIPLLPFSSPKPKSKSKLKGKQKAIVPDAEHGEDVLMQADKDDTVLQDPEQLAQGVDLTGEGVPVVKKKKKKRKVVDEEMQVDQPEPPSIPKKEKKRKSEVVQPEDSMQVDEKPKKKSRKSEPEEKRQLDEQPKIKSKAKKSKKEIVPPEEQSAAIVLPQIPAPSIDKPIKVKSEKKKAKQKSKD